MLDSTPDDPAPVDAQATWDICPGPELVRISTAMLPDGTWVYGYYVYWLNGRTSVHLPDPNLGLFASQRDAQLYAVGFMLMYESFFSPATVEDLRIAEARLCQTELSFE